jgi:hypothetical protein
MSSADSINALLNDKLFQVIGSTPASIAESLNKIDLRNRGPEGVQIAAVAIFAAAVNKATLETFLADPRFANIRPLLSASLSIQGKSNMTAMTLFGHCLLTTELMGQVEFAKEFRKKMGQDHLWAGDLDKGSLSDKQKEILKEKKRVTKEEDAKALGSGFLKHVGVSKGAMTAAERDLFPGLQAKSAQAGDKQEGAPKPSASGKAPETPARQRPVNTPGGSPTTEAFGLSTTEEVQIPAAVLAYRRDALKSSEKDIAESISRNGVEKFISNTERLMARDPTGEKTRAASAIGS